MPRRQTVAFDEVPRVWDGWYLYSAAAWRRDWARFAEFFFGQVFNEPHSTKQIEDAVDWALDTDPETIITGEDAAYLPGIEPAGASERSASPEPAALGYARRVRCPSLVIHGDADAITHISGGRRLAEALGARLVVLTGSGHNPLGREPVKVNLLIREFARRVGRSA
jgi:pimeloyl-ACP methyl ester carboxylesterase